MKIVTKTLVQFWVGLIEAQLEVIKQLMRG